jgi:hypothetical protein
MRVLSEWVWPAQLEKSDESWTALYAIIKNNGEDVTNASLNYAANTLISRNNAAQVAATKAAEAASAAAHKWLTTSCPVGLKGPNGKLSQDNYTAIVNCIENEFAGAVTVQNLSAAVKILTERKQLRWAVAQSNQDAKTNKTVSGLNDHSKTSVISGDEAWKLWLTKAPAGLKDSNGKLHMDPNMGQSAVGSVEALRAFSEVTGGFHRGETKCVKKRRRLSKYSQVAQGRPSENRRRLKKYYSVARRFPPRKPKKMSSSRLRESSRRRTRDESRRTGGSHRVEESSSGLNATHYRP